MPYSVVVVLPYIDMNQPRVKKGNFCYSNSVFHSVGTQGSEDNVSLNVHLGTILDLSLISEELQVVCKEAKYTTSTF